MHPQIRRLGMFLMLLYVALFVQLNVVQIFGAERIQDDPNNTRPLVLDYGQPRGSIVTADGVVVAQSVETPDGPFDRQRLYPAGARYGHVGGFFSFNYGASGVEQEYNDVLAGLTDEQQLGGLTGIFDDVDTTADVYLTLRDDVQRVAQEALGEQLGSVVAIDPRDGAILAMYSWPSPDPTFLATPSANDAETAWEIFNALDPNPLLPRAYRENFFPGSTFKVVTAAAGLESGVVTPAEPVYPVLEAYTPPLTDRPLRNFDGNECGGALFDILRRSCNSSFAQMGVEHIGPALLIETAENFGFNATAPIDLPAPGGSTFPTEFGETFETVEEFMAERDLPFLPAADGRPVDLFGDAPRLAQASIGQNDVKATPLQMALVAAAVANEGQIMRPHVMDRVVDRRGDEIDDYDDGVWRQAMRPSVADMLRQAMVGVVEGGTAQRLAIPGFQVGGKTGTAQLGTEDPQSHAWIIGFAGPPGEVPHVAVAVIVEAQPGASEQTGGRVAAPIAQAVMAQALQP